MSFRGAQRRSNPFIELSPMSGLLRFARNDLSGSISKQHVLGYKSRRKRNSDSPLVSLAQVSIRGRPAASRHFRHRFAQDLEPRAALRRFSRQMPTIGARAGPPGEKTEQMTRHVVQADALAKLSGDIGLEGADRFKSVGDRRRLPEQER